MSKQRMGMDSLPSPLVYPLPDSDRLVEIVSEILGEPIDWVRNALREEESHLGRHQLEDFRRLGIQPHVWHDKLIGYYKDTRFAILGHPAWNRRPEKLKLREWIGHYLARERQTLKILTVGDGSGFDSLYLSLCGHRVTYSEENHLCTAFARKIFEDCEANVRIVEDSKQLDKANYDVIVCLDVLEHVPDPQDMVRWMVELLHPQGRLIVHAPFFFVTHHNPTHLACNRKYSGDLSRLYRANGLALVDGRTFWDPLVFVKADTPPDAGWLRRAILRHSGWLLRVGRYWNWPHNWVAARATQRGCARWQA